MLGFNLAAEWSRPDADFATRQAHLLGQLAGGYNGPNALTAATVVADDAADDLLGGDGADWFVIRLDSTPDAARRLGSAGGRGDEPVAASVQATPPKARDLPGPSSPLRAASRAGLGRRRLASYGGPDA